MRLALAIVFLWLGGALLWVAFSGMSKDGQHSESLQGKPGDVVQTLQDAIAAHASAYAAPASEGGTAGA